MPNLIKFKVENFMFVGGGGGGGAATCFLCLCEEDWASEKLSGLVQLEGYSAVSYARC